jgi:hypothetical protein
LLASSAATHADPHCFSEDSEAVARQSIHGTRWIAGGRQFLFPVRA